MEHLHTDRLEAARFQKLPTTIKRQYNTILPMSSSLQPCYLLIHADRLESYVTFLSVAFVIEQT